MIVGVILGGVLVFVLLAIIGNQNLTGNTINPYTPQQSNPLTEQVIIDNEQQINKQMYYSQTFEVLKPAKIFINITSDDFIDYALLPDYEVEHYTKGESFKSYENLEGTLFIQNTYNLNAGGILWL